MMTAEQTPYAEEDSQICIYILDIEWRVQAALGKENAKVRPSQGPQGAGAKFSLNIETQGLIPGSLRSGLV